MNQPKLYLSADEVIEQLGINKATLYSYVSRGLLRSEEGNGKTRNRRYWAEDVEALFRRKENRRNPERAAEGALDWGNPVLESKITLIENGRLYYRGYDATKLAQSTPFEEVAALLWNEEIDASQLFASNERNDVQRWRAHFAQPGGLRMIDRFQSILPLAAADDLAAYDLNPDAVARTGARILKLLTAIVGSDGQFGLMAEQLQKQWAPHDEGVKHLINSALILCADHELNVSSFTARCAASAGSTPYAVVNAGLSALQGVRHGGHTERVEALFREVAHDPRQAIFARLKRGELIPGFGHQLYPLGDPRAMLLLGQLEQKQAAANRLAVAREMIDAVEHATQLKPNLDFALVVLAQSYELPQGSPLTLFALGRVAGWIGHAIEQYSSGQLIRPRARYIGKPVAESVAEK